MGVCSSIDIDRIACSKLGVYGNRAGSPGYDALAIQSAGNRRYPCSRTVDGDVAIRCIDLFGAHSG